MVVADKNKDEVEIKQVKDTDVVENAKPLVSDNSTNIKGRRSLR